MGSSAQLGTYLDAVERYGLLHDRDEPRIRDRLVSHERVLRNRIGAKFVDVDFEGKRVLDIGAGSGRYSLYAAHEGAERVVALEPEGSGGRAVFDTLERLAADYPAIGVDGNTFQAFDPGGETFDVLLSHNSINHLDEDACRALHRSDDAVARYRNIFDKLSDVAADGATLVVADASRYNVFGDLDLPNPVASEIDWDVHQPPEVWSALLAAHGFVEREIRWVPLFSLLVGSRTPVLENKVTAYLTNSHFVLVMDKQPVDG